MTTIEKTNLLCQFYKENPEIVSVLFNTLPKEKSKIEFRYIFTNLHYVLKKVWWICQLDDSELSDFGICNDDIVVRYFPNFCELKTICQGFENIPLWFKKIRVELNEEIEDYERDCQPSLDIYLKWCHEHGIYPERSKVFDVLHAEDDPLFFTSEHEYLDPLSSDATLCINYPQFGDVKTIESIPFPVSENLPPCLEPEFTYSGSGDIYREFFEFDKKYPRSATYYSVIFEEFGKEIFERFQEEKSLFIRTNIDKKPDIFINMEDLHR